MCCNGLSSHHLTININLLSPKNENKVPYFPSKGFFNTLIKKKKKCFKEAPYEYLKLANVAKILILSHTHMEYTYFLSNSFLMIKLSQMPAILEFLPKLHTY